MTKPSAKDIQKAFAYDPQAGIFRWKKHRTRKFVGKIAGFVSKQKGYWLLTLRDQKVLGHIAAWCCYYGKYPKTYLDHIDLDKNNNRISNLRLSSKSNNGANRPPQINNTSGYKGVFWSKAAKKWMVQIKIRNRLCYGGLFTSKIDAASRYDEMATRGFGEHARLNLEKRP